MSDAFAVGFRAAPGKEVWSTPAATLALTGEALADWNVALIFGGDQPAEQLRTFHRLAHERSLPFLVLAAAELADTLAPAAQGLGLTHAGSMPLMVHRSRVAAVAPTPYQIALVESEQDLLAANAVGAAAFHHPVEVYNRLFTLSTLEAPGVAFFLARRDGVPMSTVLTVRGGTTVGVFNMGTPPDHQRKGAGHALLTQVIAWHHDRGARLFYLMATEAGYPLYERIGFQTVSTPSVWAAGQFTQGGG